MPLSPPSRSGAQVRTGAEATEEPLPPSERYAMSGQRIGGGGMGEVHLVIDRWLGRAIAMKVLRDGSTARFRREARVQGQLEHPAIVPLYDTGVDAYGRPYFTMRHVRGATLGTILKRLALGDHEARACYTRSKLLRAFAQVCLAVDYAHGRGVIHRDLKPANIMLGSFGEVHVLDWGVAKIQGDDSLDEPVSDVREVDATGHGEWIGTAGYMSPEHIAGEAVDPRADVYSLGVVLFEILTLERLHRGLPEIQAASSLVEVDVDARLAASHAEDVSPMLAAIVERAIRVDPAKRHASARELGEAVEDYLDRSRDGVLPHSRTKER